MTSVAARIQGSIPALVTPMRDGKVDEQAFRKLVSWQIEQGSHGLVPCGTTGESPTLSHEEHMRVVEICVQETAGRVPVIAGAGSNSTDEAIALTRHAKAVGADAVLHVTGYYNKPSQEGHVSPFHGDCRCGGYSHPALQHPRPRHRGHSGGHHGAPGQASQYHRGEGRHGQFDAPDAGAQRLRKILAADLGRGRHGAGLHGAWRPWLHFRHRQCRAQALRGIPGCLPARRL